jgi:hypothetical protein
LGDFNVGCWFLRREIFLEVVAVDLLGKLLSRGASQLIYPSRIDFMDIIWSIVLEF